jgi:hypothetical protein
LIEIREPAFVTSWKQTALQNSIVHSIMHALWYNPMLSGEARMTFLSFLSKADFVASVVIDCTVLFLSFLAYRRTGISAFAFLIWASLIGVILEVGLHLRTPSSAEDALSFRQWYRVGYFAATVLWGIGLIQLIQYVRRDFERKSPNTTLEPTAAAPSVSNAPSNPKIGGESTSDSGGGGSALNR